MRRAEAVGGDVAPARRGASRRRRWIAVGLIVALLAGCATGGPPPTPAADASEAALIVVAVADSPEALPAIGGTPRAAYAGRSGYAGGHRGAAQAEQVARDHGLVEQKAWTIDPLHWRCILYRIAAGADRAVVLARLNADPRVRLAQPLNRFETLAGPYNDPYVGMQRGFAAVNAGAAQRWSSGEGVRVAVIDTAVDASHPDLVGRIVAQRDFGGVTHPSAPGGESHGTGMAGVIAAAANNGVGIVGMAPRAQVLAYRACWPAATAGASRCDSFTLAQALGAAITDRADVINLSLGGPADPLLGKLTEYAMAHGAIVVGAVPVDGSLDGFPVGVPGVLAVASSDGPLPAGRRVLSAPGREILTLSPGGHYDFASGSSLAAAHVSGLVALLLALQPGLQAGTVQGWLQRPDGAANGPFDACAAVHRLRAEAACDRAPVPTSTR